MGILTDEMKRVVTELQLCYAATVTPDGKQNLSPKGSITILSDAELGFADLASLGTIENLRHNRAIELNVVDPFTRRGVRFKGRARVIKDPEAHRRIAQVLGPDYPFEQVVKIRVDLASEVFSPVYTLIRLRGPPNRSHFDWRFRPLGCLSPFVSSDKKKFEAWLADRISAEGPDAAALRARQLMVLLDGAVAQMPIHRDPLYATAAGQLAAALLGKRAE